MKLSPLFTGSVPLIARAAAPVSSGCQAFLSTLDATVAPVIKCHSGDLTTATSAASFTQAFCGKTCPSVSAPTIIQFGDACAAELQDTSSQVFTMYDSLYALGPMAAAVCSTDSVGVPCLVSMTSANQTFLGEATNSTDTASASVSAASGGSVFTSIQDAAKAAIAALASKASSAVGLSDYNAAFLFIPSAAPAAQVCTSCVRTIISAFLQVENQAPFTAGNGLSSSKILGGQASLWSGLTSKCGQTYMASIEALAGSPQTSTSAAGRSAVAAASAVVAAVVAFVL